MICVFAFAAPRRNIIAPMSLTPAVPPPDDKPIRVVIQQPNLARYRLPVYQELAKRPGIDLHLVYGDDGTVPSVPPEGICATFSQMRIYKFLGSEMRWHAAQLDWTDPKHADVVILSWSTRYLSLVPGLLRARRRGVGSVLWGHGYSKAETGLSAKTRNRVSDLADALLFYNQSIASEFIQQGRSKPERVFVALNALDQTQIAGARDAWLADPARLEAFKKQHELNGTPNLLFVSRFDRRNRVDLLLDAVASLQDRFPGMVVNLVGKGPEEADLRAQARSLGIASKVRFLGAIYNEHELAPWFLAATAFVYPSNIGLSLLHAFGYGLPVITSNDRSAQNPEFEAIKPGVNGLTYAAGSVAGLAGAIEKVCESASVRESLSTNAHQTAAQEFTLRRMIDGMEAAIRYAAKRAGRLAALGCAVIPLRFLAEPAAWCML
jgi:glycosyltransferase involved in cell wall biosynthesis